MSQYDRKCYIWTISTKQSKIRIDHNSAFTWGNHMELFHHYMCIIQHRYHELVSTLSMHELIPSKKNNKEHKICHSSCSMHDYIERKSNNGYARYLQDFITD